jgi:hypothetical protein
MLRIVVSQQRLREYNAAQARERRAWLKQSPAEFRKSLLIDADGRSLPFASCLDPWQRSDFLAIDPAWERLVGLHDRPCIARAYLERGRGHSKTTDLAAMALWALYASPRKIVGVAVAAKKEQAGFLRNAIDILIRLNPWLADEIVVHKWTVINIRTGSEFNILAANEHTNYGHTPDFVICDEVTHWPKEELWTSIFSAVAKRAKCVCVVIANAGFGRGVSWHWNTREKARLDPRWHFHRLEGPVASWLTKENLEEQRAHLTPMAYRRLWLNQWVANVGDALDMDAVERACTLEGPVLLNPFETAMAGLDMGLAHDHAGFVVLGINRAARKLRLLHTHRWNPREFPNGRISFNVVQGHVIDTCKRLHVEGVAYDLWQCEHLAENLRLAGITTYGFPATPENSKRMALELLDSVNHELLELYRDENLLTDLARLNIVEKPLGYKIEAPKDEGGHCDLRTAFCIANPWARSALFQY